MPPVETAAPAGSATESSATPFEQDLGAMFGDYSTADATPEPEASAAGTTPAEPAPGTETETASEPAATADGTTDTPSDGTTPAAASESGPTNDDPFKDTTAASYVLNGQPVSVEDIRVFKEGGAVIRPESLPNVLSKLAERDTLSSENRTVKQQMDTLNRVIEWKDPSGKTYTGADAAIENRIANASLFAENNLMLPVFTSEDLQPYLTTKTVRGADGAPIIGADGKPQEVVIFRPDFLQSLSEKARFQKEQIDFTTRKHYAGVIADSSKAQPAPINFEQAAPELVKLVAQSANLDASVLTAEDKATLAEQLPFHLKDGLASVAWQNLAKRLMSSRAKEKSSAQTIASTTEKATKEGQARMAAAARGVRQPVAKTTVTPAKTPTPAAERLQNEGELFDAMQRAGSRAMRANL